ncbi:MAG: sensor histidine kinase, partial [Luteimonas sp.]|nr:sensor histidine kinase [Luteimonas sp.]
MTAIRMPGWWSAAPDSVAAAALRQGRSPWLEMVHLLWSAWVFITPVFTPEGYSARWLVLTLTSFPLFVLLYAMSLRAPARHAYRYALGMVALSMVLLPVYPSGISYFVFGCVMMRLHRSRGAISYLLQLVLLNAVFLTYSWLIGDPWQSVVWLPVTTLVIGIVVNVERANKEKDAALKLSHEEVRRLAATAER